MLCPHCGAEVHEEACFCVECGRKTKTSCGGREPLAATRALVATGAKRGVFDAL